MIFSIAYLVTNYLSGAVLSTAILVLFIIADLAFMEAARTYLEDR